MPAPEADARERTTEDGGQKPTAVLVARPDGARRGGGNRLTIFHSLFAPTPQPSITSNLHKKPAKASRSGC